MLHTLNLSNNFIRSVDPGLGRCQNLTVLNLSMNHIQDISYLPSLSNLAVLYLNNNKVKNFTIKYKLVFNSHLGVFSLFNPMQAGVIVIPCAVQVAAVALTGADIKLLGVLQPKPWIFTKFVGCVYPKRI